jgi:hypothetical protein
VLGVGCSFAEFNAYDVGLCCESSSSSCCLSAGSFLQPVPSLPGLAEPLNGSLYAPAGARHAGFSTVKLTKQPAASFGSSSGSGGSTSLSPTQHLAWRPAHGSHARSEFRDFAAGSCMRGPTDLH